MRGVVRASFGCLSKNMHVQDAVICLKKKSMPLTQTKQNKTGTQTYTGMQPFFLPDVIFLHLPGISNVHLFSPCPSLSHTQTSTIAAGLISISLQLKLCTQGLAIHCCWKVVGMQLFQVLHIYQPHLHSGQFIMMSDAISRPYILTDVSLRFCSALGGLL